MIIMNDDRIKISEGRIYENDLEDIYPVRYFPIDHITIRCLEESKPLLGEPPL